MSRSCHHAGALLSCLVFLAPAYGAPWLDPGDPAVQTVLNTQDNEFAFGTSPSSQSGWLLNYGAATATRVRGWRNVTGLKFDLSAFRGRIVQQAELHLAKADSNVIFSLVVATINGDWNEGTLNGGQGVGNACWRWRSTPVNSSAPAPGDEWTFSHSDFSTASFGSYGSLVCYAYGADGTYGGYAASGKNWVRAQLDPAVVQALILDQYGLMVTDARNCYAAGPDVKVSTKEAGASSQPRLYIKFADTTDTTPPGAVNNLTVEAGPENGEVVLHFAAPTDPEAPKAFGYTVRYSLGGDFGTATDAARWQIPRPKSPGTPQRVLLEGLNAGSTYTFFVQAYDAAGNGGPVANMPFTLPPAQPAPTLADGGLVIPSPAGKTVKEVPGVLRYWAVSEVIKVNPATGNRIEDGYTGTGADDYKKANVVWDAGTNTMSLRGCRNEMVAAQLILERIGASLNNVQVTVSDLVGTGGVTIPADPCIELFQLHAVNASGAWYPDAAIPLFAPFPTTFNIPDANHNPSGNKNQAVWMDLYIPKDALPGQYNATITVAATQLASPVTINLNVKVSPVRIPDYPTFLVDLNGYASGGHPWDGFANADLARLRYFQTAHKHRAVCNLLPYGWGANVRPDRCPTLTGAGATLHADNWSLFDTRFGPFLDGSAFRPDTPASPYYGPGTNTPITHMYTPFFESWPIHIQDPLYGFDAAGNGGLYWDDLVDTDYNTFFATMPDIYPSFPEGYKQGVRNVVADWFGHAHEKGWTRTAFQTYLNHKYYYIEYADCAALWILEENESADDFRATGFFQQLYREGQAQAGVPDVKWHFRIDISTRWSEHYGQLDNRVNFQMMSSASAGWHWPQTQYRNYHLDVDKQEEWNWYGLGPAINRSGTDFPRVFLQKWCQGFTGGLLYWDNYQTSWTTGNDLSTVYSGSSVPGFGTYEGPIFSTRIKMMRQSQQVIELLNLLGGAPGWDRAGARAALAAKYSSNTWDYSFGSLSENQLYRLRADLAAMLETLVVLPGDADGDGDVDVFDVIDVVIAFGSVPGAPNWNPNADHDYNGSVDIFDVITAVNAFGTTL